MARILSVEDDPDLQHMLSLALQGQGYELHYAFTGREGYEKALLLNPDLILADMMLPVLNGVEMIKLIKANKTARDIPIIVMTAFSRDASCVESVVKPLGVLEYMRKPVQLEELSRLIKRILKGQANRTLPSLLLCKGVVRLDPKFRAVYINDKLVATLAPKRFEIMLALVENRGEVSCAELLKRVWSDDAESKNTLEKTIQRLREDLGSEGAARIQTTPLGYELVG
ncbi:MAG: response regulator transcription factor [Elusimicrobia bacterium]|nr:response regulator transcription factor [Elusimicrobiota bacterium]